jgi:hypothetical protein
MQAGWTREVRCLQWLSEKLLTTLEARLHLRRCTSPELPAIFVTGQEMGYREGEKATQQK